MKHFRIKDLLITVLPGKDSDCGKSCDGGSSIIDCPGGCSNDATKPTQLKRDWLVDPAELAGMRAILQQIALRMDIEGPTSKTKKDKIVTQRSKKDAKLLELKLKEVLKELGATSQ